MEKLVRFIARVVGINFVINVAPILLALLPVDGVRETAQVLMSVFVYVIGIALVLAITEKEKK